MKIRYFDAPDLKQVGKNGYRFVNAVSDFVGHASPSRITENYEENNWGRIINGHPIFDKAVNLMMV